MDKSAMYQYIITSSTKYPRNSEVPKMLPYDTSGESPGWYSGSFLMDISRTGWNS